jgi:hypothetical protein
MIRQDNPGKLEVVALFKVSDHLLSYQLRVPQVSILRPGNLGLKVRDHAVTVPVQICNK